MEISELILDGSFEDNLAPNIVNVVSLVNDVNVALNSEFEANSPLGIMRNIFASAEDI